jgi:pilus assembly protein Flp/PilA
MKQIRKFAADQSGATAVEYGALVMFVGLALVVTLEAIGLSLEGTFTALKSVFASAGTGTGG